MTTVYKVVLQQEDGKMTSVVNGKETSKYVCSYELGVETLPRIGKLFAFSTLEYAQGFAAGSDRRLVLECEAVVSDVVLAYVAYPFDMWIEEFWQPVYFPEWKNNFMDMHTPVGTVFCDSITPQRIVE